MRGTLCTGFGCMPVGLGASYWQKPFQVQASSPQPNPPTIVPTIITTATPSGGSGTSINTTPSDLGPAFPTTPTIDPTTVVEDKPWYKTKLGFVAIGATLLTGYLLFRK